MKNLYAQVAFQTSELITRRYSTSFSAAVRLLSPDMRKAIYSIYGFVRLADEIVDSFVENDREQLLARLEADFHEALSSGISINPVLYAFALTVKRYGIPQKHIEAFLNSMKADLVKNEYHSPSETDEYIYGSAGVVGLMCLRVFVNGQPQLYDELEQPAMKLGYAFQKVNFLRDLKADLEQLDRSYFAGFNIQSFDESAKAALISDIENDFLAAKAGIPRLPGRTKIAVLLAWLYYRQLLRKLKHTPAEKIIKTRIRVSDTRKYLLFVRAWLSYSLRMI